MSELCKLEAVVSVSSLLSDAVGLCALSCLNELFSADIKTFTLNILCWIEGWQWVIQ